MTHLWHQYWSWTGGNIGAMPFEALVTAAAAFVFRGPLGRLLGAGALEEAKAGRRIAADLHERLTGDVHPDAPGKDGAP